MKTPSDKIKWIQASLAVLILAILMFLALSPSSHAASLAERHVEERPTTDLEFETP